MRFLATAVVANVALLDLITSTVAVPYVDTAYAYTGPAVPIGDWVDQTVKGNGKGFPRLVEPPAVKPSSNKPRNNINVISLAYIPGGMSVHFQTPFGIGSQPKVKWGEHKGQLKSTAVGTTTTYDRTPPCSLLDVTQCSQFFHSVQIPHLKPDTVYYYSVPGGNGTTPSDVLTFKTAKQAGQKGQFTVAVVNDWGYVNGGGTHQQMAKSLNEGVAFAWHGGDISYADDWYSGILPCASDWPVCYNGTHTALPGGKIDNPQYDMPLPKGEIPNQGGPWGGDMSVIYESNWDLWQQWMNPIWSKIPYMVMPGNHEAACAEFDGPNNILTAYLNNNQVNGSAPKTDLTYYSCPPSQRNFTRFQHAFRMPGQETGGVSNFWYSFDYGDAHFVSFTSETDYYKSPSYPFIADLSPGEAHPTREETHITDAGPFGDIQGSYKDTTNYEQYQWLKKDLAAVDRKKTPWAFAMSHRPMYSSQVSKYQANLRNAFEDLFLEYKVDAYLAGHIHWYERLFPLGKNGTIDSGSIINNNTYKVNPGKSITHIVNGQAGNIESHSELGPGAPVLPITAHLDAKAYGFSKLTVFNSTTAKFEFQQGDGSIGDHVWLVK